MLKGSGIIINYDGSAIIKDVNEKPVPQYWNEELGRFEVISSKGGLLKVTLTDSSGNYVSLQPMVDQISTKLDELIGVINSGL